MSRLMQTLVPAGLVTALVLAGCNSPYHADRGALAGGLLGAGTGAILGHAAGNTGAGAAIGAGIGAISGGLIGQGQDEIEAHNREMIAQQLGRQVQAGAVSISDVVAMTKAGVADELIVNHIRAHGVAAPLQSSDLIYLQQQGVSSRVIAAMQEPPRVVQQQAVVVTQPSPPPVVVDGYYYDGPHWGGYYPYWRHRYCHPRPRVGIGFTIP